MISNLTNNSVPYLNNEQRDYFKAQTRNEVEHFNAARDLGINTAIKPYHSTDIDLSGPQFDFAYNRQPSVALIAGFGSGKTFTLWMKLWSWLCEYPGVMHGYFAPTHGLIRDILYPMVSEWCEASKVRYTIVQHTGMIYIHGLGSIICRSMENPERIVGFETGNCAVDEIDILPIDKAWHAWRKIKARCRTVLYDKGGNEVPNQMAVASTPEGFKMAYQAFVQDPIPNSRLFRMSTYHNLPNLPASYIPDLKNNYPQNLIDAYIYGRFVNLRYGTVYNMFDRFLNNAPGAINTTSEPLHIGMDFNVQNMAAVIHVQRQLADMSVIPIAVGELAEVFDTPTMIKLIQALYPGNPIFVYPDASGKARKTVGATQSDLSLLQDAGFIVLADSSNPAVKDRINSMNAMFCNMNGIRRYYVNVQQCPRYTQTLEQQAYDDNGQPDKTSNHDHLNDAGGYYITQAYGIMRSRASAEQVRTH